MRIKDLLALVGLHTFYYPDLAASLSLLFFDNNKPSSVFYLKRSRALSRLFKSCLKAVIVVLVAPGRTAPQTSEAPLRTVESNIKIPPKMRLINFVKLTDHTCTCSGLTNFECEAQATGNRSYVNMQNLAWKNS
jgi:hypothetical protein